MNERVKERFVHRFEPATAPGRPPLLLLHGTGGDERDLLDLGRAVAPGSALLSPRGQVLEGGMPRFFRRLAEGVLDQEDLVARAGDLADFVEDARSGYAIGSPVALGFSNGANIASAALMLRPSALSGAVLLRPMLALKEPPDVDLAGTPVLIVSGALDPLVTDENAAELAAMLQARGAVVTHRTVGAGHGLVGADVELVQAWLALL